MNLLKTSILSFIATSIKILSGLVINKAIAVYIGPSGLALIGQFQNFSRIAMAVAQGAINTGVTKYTAEYGKDSERLNILFITASKISLVSSATVGVGLFVFSSNASDYFLKTEDYKHVFLIFSFTIVLFVINNLLLSIINGLKEIRTWISVNIIQSIYSLIFTTLLIAIFGLNGALIALVTNQSVVLIVVLWMIRKHPLLKVKAFTTNFSSTEAKKLAGFAITTLITLLSVPISLTIIIRLISEIEGLEDAGYWQAIWYISSMSLLIFMTVIRIYFLPKLSETQDRVELRSEIAKGITLFLFVAFFAFLAVYYLRNQLIVILFSESFMSMADLFFWQLAGDFLKLTGSFFGILLSAKAKNIRASITNVIFSLLFVTLVYVFIGDMGLQGVVFAHFLNNVIFLIFVIGISWDILYGKSCNNNTNV